MQLIDKLAESVRTTLRNGQYDRTRMMFDASLTIVEYESLKLDLAEYDATYGRDREAAAERVAGAAIVAREEA